MAILHCSCIMQSAPSIRAGLLIGGNTFMSQNSWNCGQEIGSLWLENGWNN